MCGGSSPTVGELGALDILLVALYSASWTGTSLDRMLSFDHAAARSERRVPIVWGDLNIWPGPNPVAPSRLTERLGLLT